MFMNKKVKLNDSAIDKVADKIYGRLKDIRQNDLDFAFRLLKEKSELQKELERNKVLREKDKDMLLLSNQKLVEQDEKIKKLEEEIASLKAEKKLISNSLGGCKTKNNKLQEKLGEQNLLIKDLQKRLSLKKAFAPTMKELLDYENHKTRKEKIK